MKIKLTRNDVVYVAGPMRGIPLYNFPAFDAASASLRRLGCVVISPADLDRQNGCNENTPIDDAGALIRQCISRDIEVILHQCTAIALLPGWQKSSGVAVELALGRFLSLKIFEYQTGEIVQAANVGRGTTKDDIATKAVKYDTGKPMLELLSPWVLIEVGKVLTYGANKYAKHNWRNGFEWTRPIGAALRHIFSWLGGEDIDAESGLPHLAHASCCLMFTLEHQLLKMGVDDRWHKED